MLLLIDCTSVFTTFNGQKLNVRLYKKKHLVGFEGRVVAKALAAVGAHERLLPGVDALVLLEMRQLVEPLVAVTTEILLAAGVGPLVQVHMSNLKQGFRAKYFLTKK